MSVGSWYISRGRIPRSTLWLRYILPILAASVVASVLDAVLGLSTTQATTTADGFSFASTIGPISGVVTLLTIVPSISSTVTRLHDRGHSAWWLLFYLLPIVGWLVLFIQTGFLAGQPQPNQYGPPPGGGQALQDPGYPQQAYGQQ